MIIIIFVMVVIILFMNKGKKLSLPFNGVYPITSRYGYRTHPVTGVLSSFHNGIDYALPIDTPLRAMSKGKVLSVYENAVGGKQLIIQYDNGFRSGFAHLQKILVAPGENVDTSTVVARSGNTGQSTGPHLHLTLRYKGELVNPENHV
ncbi:MAG: M23 family metallopeptidase [Candidatus Kapabacteria bacterium]|jgi:murein DD-endopeptidase|nr:M23 family metallopeptidase [Candidatus Kapabacteria bacterium]